MKIPLLLLFLFKAFTFAIDESNIPLNWVDENKCSFSFKQSPQMVLKEKIPWNFEIEECNGNNCGYSFFRTVTLKVFCPKKENYCKMTDTYYFKAMPKSADRRAFCGKLDIDDIYFGKYLDVPFEKKWSDDDVVIGCDFIAKVNPGMNARSGIFVLKGPGVCPVWIKYFENEYDLYIFQITTVQNNRF